MLCEVSYAKSFVDDWIKQLQLLTIIAESEPQSAYSAFVGGFKRTRTYFLLASIRRVVTTIRRYYPAITGGHLCLENECILLSLPVRFGGLAIPLFYNDVKYKYEISRKLAFSLTQSIKNQYQIYSVNETEQKSIKLNIKISKEERYKATLIELQTQLDENQMCLNYITQEKGVSSWLKVYPISDQGYDLNKQQFWDCVRLVGD